VILKYFSIITKTLLSLSSSSIEADKKHLYVLLGDEK
jgi:hypothetical protein